MECPACGHDAPLSGRYCPACGVGLDASQSPTATVATVRSFPSSRAIDGAQFAAGTVLVGRYRIVGLLGRGGMGEVYRAEDLKLEQAVALKFLPRTLTDDAVLARFHQEVRLARQVAHPNVCRVFDISETAGQHFLSMEYIDGEDLASLLRRIGRLPPDKALELAHQLCAGLSAAHDCHVLHRDLKPANVLIDGRGRAHLVDFGIAALDGLRALEIAGTFGYMAPEQEEGREVTTRTDIYALGLVLYEMFTGRRALADGGALVRRRAQSRVAPTSPSTHLADLDPAIERVIMRCLEADPARRPRSASAVAAALPGGNPLAVAMAAGETPSPDMVAAAGEAGTLSPATGVLGFAAVLVGLTFLTLSAHDVNLIGLTRIELTPARLTERAHAVLRALGHTDPTVAEAIGFESDVDYLQYIEEHDQSATRWRRLAAAQPPALSFWYRQSPRPLAPLGGGNIVSRSNPPNTRSGMISLTLDRTGRLVSFLAVPAQLEMPLERSDPLASDPARAWSLLFAEAGLPGARFTPATPQWVPPTFADARAAWEGVYPDRPDVPIRVEAATARGRPVYFEIVAPWTRPTYQDPPAGRTSQERFGLFMRSVIGPIAFGIALLLALRNLRLGRGDRRGAVRVSLFIFGTGVLSSVLATGGLQVLSRGEPIVFFVPAAVWLLYIALEPHFRRVWPGVMIGWSRLISGSLRDPLVGRDVLVGVLVAVGDGLLLALHAAIRRWSGRPPLFPVGASANPFDGMVASSDLLLGGRYAVSRIIGSMVTIPVLVWTMLTFLLLFVLFVLLRKRWLAVVAMILGLTVMYAVTHGGWLLAYAPVDRVAPSVADVVFFGIVQSAIVLVVVRFGLLSMLVASFVSLLVTLMPIGIDSSVPYASSSWMVLATIIALAAYGWHTALGGRPLLDAGWLRD
jgi:serine/threonine-protein kinase